MTARRSLRLRLAFGTALTGGTLAMAGAALAQTSLPTNGEVIAPATGVTVNGSTVPPATAITPDQTAATLDIGVNQQATVIRWDGFDVAAGRQVNFHQDAALAATLTTLGRDAVVVNRVTGTSQSTINGRITTYADAADATTRQNTSVWLLNPNGILIGGSGAIDVGGFLGSTLDLCGSTDCSGVADATNLAALASGDVRLRLAPGADGTRAVTIADSQDIRTTGALVLVAGAVDVRPAKPLQAGGEVNLVAATDVTVHRAGSPVVFQIDRGSEVAGTLIRTGGSISGSSVVIAAARPDGLAEALLSIGGTITASGVGTGARGVVLLGGTGQTDPSIAVVGDPTTPTPTNVVTVAAGNGGPVGIDSAAALKAEALDVLVNATGAVTIGGGVSAARDYRVSGGVVTLGDATSTPATRVVQAAGGAVTVRAMAGDIVGLGSLSLAANSAGATGSPLTLASAGAIRFGADTMVIGGNGTAAGAVDVRVVESTSATATSFGTVSGRSLGAIPASAGTTPLPLTLYGATTLGTVTLDRGLDLTIATGGGVIGSLSAGSIVTGANGADAGAGVAGADPLRILTAGSARLGSVESRTGDVTVTASNGDITGQALSGGGFGATTLTAAVARAGGSGVLGVGNGSIDVTAGNGLVQLASARAGNDVTVTAQKIDAGIVQAAAVSDDPVAGTGAGGTATLHATAHGGTADAVDLRVGTIAAGTGTATRQGGDVLLTADAAGGTALAGTIDADGRIEVLAGNGANGAATVAGNVRAGRVDTAGGYAVTAGQVVLGATLATVTQSASATVAIRSTAGDITGSGTLTLQSNADGAGGGTLTLDSAGAIGFDPSSRLFAGTGSATGNADLLVSESAATAATRFGQVRAARLGALGGGATLILYGATSFGQVDLDRSLALSVRNGGGQTGTLTAGALTLGVNPVDAGAGTALADTLTLTTVGSARLASATSRTGSLSITATDGDVTGLSNGIGYDRVALSAAQRLAGTPAIADGNVSIFAGRDGNGGTTGTLGNGLALLGDVTAGGDVRVDARAVDATLARSVRSLVSVTAAAADGAITGAGAEALTLGTAVSGLGTTLDAQAGSLRIGTVDAGTAAVAGTTDGAVLAQAYGNARIGVVAPTVATPGGILSRIGDVTVTSLHGDITGGGTTAAYGGANLRALDGNVLVTASAQAVGAAEVGRIDLATVFAQTAEALAGSAAAPLRGNIRVVGRSVDVASAETGRFADGATVANSGGGSLYLEAREGSAASDVHVTLGSSLVGTTATLIAGLGSLAGATDPNGNVSVGTLEAGRNRVIGTGTALPGTITVQAANAVRADTLASRTGSVLVTATSGDVTGYTGGRLAATAAQAAAAAGTDLAVADGEVTIRAASPVAGLGVARLGRTLAGGTVLVEANAIDAAGQGAQSDRGSVTYTSLAGDLTLGTATAGIDVTLDARAPGTATVGTISAGRNVTVAAANDAAVAGSVTAGTAGVGYYHVTAGRDVALGDDATPAALAAADLQSAVDEVRIVAVGGITGARGLVLRSNSAGQFDGSGDAAGVRDLTLDAGGSIALALPDGLSGTTGDAIATRLIGGSDLAPQQSVVRVRAAGGTTLTLGNVTARALRSIGTTPVAATYPDFAARVGANVLYHDGDVRAGSVDVAGSLGLFAFGSGGDRLLQIDAAQSRSGNVELVASGELRGYQLAAAGGATPLGRFVGTDITASAGRVDGYARSALLDDVVAGSVVELEAFGDRLRVDTVASGTIAPIAGSGIRLLAQGDLRLTSAVAARGDVLAQAATGSVTGLPVPDTGAAIAGYAPVTRIEASDGNVVVNALGSGTNAGLVAAATLVANSTETPGMGAPARGNVSVTGQAVGIGTATAELGSLTLAARPGGAAPVATGIVLGNGSAGTAATVTVAAGGAGAASQANGSAVIGTLLAGTNALSGGATVLNGDVAVTAAGNVRVGTAESRTGNVTLTATDGDVTGLDDGAGGYGRAALTAAAARAGTPAVANGNVGVFAGRDAAGALTASGSKGLALLGTVAGGGDVTVLAQAIDATRAQAGGAILARAYAADGAVTGSATESLVMADAISDGSTTLTAVTGSVRASVGAGRRRSGTAGGVSIDAARNVRIGSAASATGNVDVVARDGNVTGLPDGAGGFDRATLTAALAAPATGTDAAVADGSVSVLAGRDAAGGLTATGTGGLARLGTVTAGSNVTIRAQAVDASRAEAVRGALVARAYADDGVVPGSGTESLLVADARAGGTATLSSAGSVRAGSAAAGLLRNGIASDLAIDAQRNVALGTASSATGNVSATARNGSVVATTLTAAVASIAQGAAAAVADGNVVVLAGRDAAGTLTGTDGSGLAQLGTVTAGGDVTVRAQRIAAGSVQAAALSATPGAAGPASGSATLTAYAHDTAGAVDLSIGSVAAGTGSATRRGLDVVLAAVAPGGTLAATALDADRTIAATANGVALVAGRVRAGRTDPGGGYTVTGSQVTLGTAGATIEQSAPGAVAIIATAGDLAGLGALTLQANGDGIGGEALTLRAARGIALAADSRLFGGIDSAAGASDILVSEGAGATATGFGEVRGRSLGGIPSGTAATPVPLTLYGATRFGAVTLDRSLDLTVANGGGGVPGTLVTGPLAVGRHPASGVIDAIAIRTTGSARFASLASTTGGVAVTVTGAGQGITADGAIDAVDAILLNAAQDVATARVTSSAGRVQIGAAAGNATGQGVDASGGAVDIAAGMRAQYDAIGARDAITVTAGTIGVGTATAGTTIAMTASGADSNAADGEALVLGTGTAGMGIALSATGGSVRATTLAGGVTRNGTLGSITIAAARNVRLGNAQSATGSVTVTARDGDVIATTLAAAVGSSAQGANAAVADGNVAVYAGRDAAGTLTATGSNGLAQIGTASAGNDVTVRAQKIAAGSVQAAAVSTTPLAAGPAGGTATLTAYAHDAVAGAVDLSVGTVNVGTGSATRRGLDAVLNATAPGGTLSAGTINADRTVSVTASGAATVSGGVRASRVDATGTYAVRAGVVTLGTAGASIEQSAAAATSITATGGGVRGLGTLLLQSNRDGAGAEALEVRATGGGIVFDPASTLRGGQATANGSNVTLAATGGATAAIDIGAVGAVGSTAALTADGSVRTRGPVTVVTATVQAVAGSITTDAVTAPTLTMQAGGSITTNGAVGATVATLRTTGGSITTNAAVTAPTLAMQAGGGITINGALTAASAATLRAVGRVTTTAAVTTPALTVQSSQIALGGPVKSTAVGLYNQATAANPTRLGGAASATDTAFDLDEAEFGRIDAATLSIGSSADDTSGLPLNTAWLRQDVQIGRLAIVPATGTTAVRVLGTGSSQTITVNGAMTINGGTANRTQNARVLQLGGAAAGAAGEAARILIVNEGESTGDAGSIATGGGVLDLRAGQIVAGRRLFIDEVLANGSDATRAFIGNPNSSLYGAGANGYLTAGTPVELITTGQLRLQFSNLALLQNTSRPASTPTGVTITGASSTLPDGQPLLLRSGSTTLSNGFALFGNFQPTTTETFFSTQAALLGPTFISNGASANGGVNPVSARLNGCLLSSTGGGCLVSSIAQPTLNVFDVTNDQVLRGSDDLVVTFDPLVGSNNEALFGDIAAGDTFDLQPCPDGTTSAQCKPSGDAKP